MTQGGIPLLETPRKQLPDFFLIAWVGDTQPTFQLLEKMALIASESQIWTEPDHQDSGG